jgi:hypothetical protein
MILTTVKIEDAPEHIHEQLGLLTGEAQDLYCAWQIFKDISIEVPETIALINKTSPFFFKRMQNLLFEHLIIGVARFTDPQLQGKNRNLTLHDLFEKDTPPQLAELEKTACNIREIRNKIVGHLDYKCGLDPTSLPNKGIIREIRESIELIEQVIEIAWQKWASGVYSISSIALSETVEVVNCLQKAAVYDRLEKAGHVPENFWNYPEDWIQKFLATSQQHRKNL